MTYKSSVCIGPLDTVTQAQMDAFQKIANGEGKQIGCTFNGFTDCRIGTWSHLMAVFAVEGKPNAQNCERFFAGVAVAVRTLIQK